MPATPAKPLAAIYARVSTDVQHDAMQLSEVRGYCQRMGWTPVEYREKVSSLKVRPEFERMMADARARKFDAVVVWKIDRFARSTKQFTDSVMSLDAAGVRFIAVTQGIDTDKQSPTGRLLMQILAAFAEFERAIIVERTRSGIAEYQRAHQAGEVGKARHSKSGKDMPCGRPRKVFRRDLAEQMRARGDSWRAIARELGVAQATIRKALAERKDAARPPKRRRGAK